MGRVQTRTDDAVVATVVERPNNPPAKVDWIVSPGSDSRITDVIAGGTSFRLTQREDYQSYLSHNNNSIDALINAMQHEVSQAS
jgi:phospholipid transport system substrate-binding protein